MGGSASPQTPSYPTLPPKVSRGKFFEVRGISSPVSPRALRDSKGGGPGMKFGKQLQRVIESTDPEWGPFYINYKFLKKRLKEFPSAGVTAVGGPHSSGASFASSDHSVHDLRQSSNEVAFFKDVHSELRKTSEFFTCMEQQMMLRRKRLKQGILYMKQPNMVLDDEAWIRMRRACVSLYKDLLLLENFAVMNYCGFSKILKKHDKNTGFETRTRFMKNVVNPQPFTHYPRVLEMLQEMERIFTEIDTLEGMKGRPMEEEERLFIEAIRGMNQEATFLSNQEKSEMGMAAARPGGSALGGGSMAGVLGEGAVKPPQQRLALGGGAEDGGYSSGDSSEAGEHSGAAGPSTGLLSRPGSGSSASSGCESVGEEARGAQLPAPKRVKLSS